MGRPRSVVVNLSDRQAAFLEECAERARPTDRPLAKALLAMADLEQSMVRIEDDIGVTQSTLRHWARSFNADPDWVLESLGSNDGLIQDAGKEGCQRLTAQLCDLLHRCAEQDWQEVPDSMVQIERQFNAWTTVMAQRWVDGFNTADVSPELVEQQFRNAFGWSTRTGQQRGVRFGKRARSSAESEHMRGARELAKIAAEERSSSFQYRAKRASTAR